MDAVFLVSPSSSWFQFISVQYENVIAVTQSVLFLAYALQVHNIDIWLILSCRDEKIIKNTSLFILHHSCKHAFMALEKFNKINRMKILFLSFKFY